MTPQDQNKVAIITGAGRGIGAAMARRFASEGIKLALVDRSLEDNDGIGCGSLKDVVEEINADGGTAEAYVVDMSDITNDYPALAEQIVDDLGGIDILINNAAANAYLPFDDISVESLYMSNEVNFMAPIKLTKAVLPYMRERGEGWVVYISSGASRFPNCIDGSNNAHTAPVMYGATKAAMDRGIISFAQEYYYKDIAFNSLAPQHCTATEALTKYSPDMPENMIEPLDATADAAYKLCSKPPRELTGEVIRSLSLICQLGEPVYAMDGKTLLEGWQPGDIPPERLLDKTVQVL